MSEFIYAECRAHEALGVSGSAMRKVRNDLLKQEVDWSLSPWNGRTVVCYTRAGLLKAIDALMERTAKERPQAAEFERILCACTIIDPPTEKTPPDGGRLGEPSLPVIWKMPKVRMVVVKKPRNPKIMLCRVHEADLQRLAAAMESRCIPAGLQRVRVRDHEKFIPHMVIGDCEHEQADLWNYLGKLPRYRGRI